MLQSNHLIGFGVGAVSLPPQTGLDVLPVMTAATTSGVTISDSPATGSPFESWKAADSSLSTRFGGTMSPTWWWKVDFGAGAAQYLASYKLTSWDTSNRMPAAWDFQGSNDDSAWTTIESRSGQTFSVTNGTNTYTLSAVAGPYRYYRFNVTANEAGGSTIEIADVQLIY